MVGSNSLRLQDITLPASEQAPVLYHHNPTVCHISTQPITRSLAPALDFLGPSPAHQQANISSRTLWAPQPATVESRAIHQGVNISLRTSQTSQPAMSGTSPTYQQGNTRSRTSSPATIHPRSSFQDGATTSRRTPQGSAASCPVTQPHPTVTGILPTRQGQGPDTHSRFPTAVSPPQQKDACSPHRGHP